jgi:hypothetical protein
MVAGLEDISSGTMKIGDRVVNTLSPKDRDIAMVFQSYALYPPYDRGRQTSPMGCASGAWTRPRSTGRSGPVRPPGQHLRGRLHRLPADEHGHRQDPASRPGRLAAYVAREVAVGIRSEDMEDARLAPRPRVRTGDQAEVVVDTERMHFFDPETGNTIRD